MLWIGTTTEIPEPHLKKFSEFEKAEKRKQEEWLNEDTLIKQFLNQLNSTYLDDEGWDITEWFFFLVVGSPVALDV